MNNVLVRLTVPSNVDDDDLVAECIERLKEKVPVSGYTFERIDNHTIQVLVWGNFHLVAE